MAERQVVIYDGEFMKVVEHSGPGLAASVELVHQFFANGLLVVAAEGVTEGNFDVHEHDMGAHFEGMKIIADNETYSAMIIELSLIHI